MFFDLMKVLVWLSWWVDSAVSAYLLQQQWFEVVGWFMKNYVDENNPNCTTKKDSQAAIKVAKFLWIELLSFDFTQEYEERIIKYIYSGYEKGITPNPDILCNNLVKFDLFLNEAKKLWFDKIATWHYARIEKGSKEFSLLRGVDLNKDQTYFLSGLNQYQLKNSLFPIWELKKEEVRKIAKKIWLPNADRKDSQWLCFVGNVPMKEFLKKRLTEKKWDILLEDGTKVWEHNWAYFFTIWQSRWLDINVKAFVTKIDVKRNIVYVAYDKNVESLEKKIIEITALHFVDSDSDLQNWVNSNKLEELENMTTLSAKIRYRQDTKKWKFKIVDWKYFFEFEEKVWWVAPGQSLVFYNWDICLGNSVIL